MLINVQIYSCYYYYYYLEKYSRLFEKWCQPVTDPNPNGSQSGRTYPKWKLNALQSDPIPSTVRVGFR